MSTDGIALVATPQSRVLISASLRASVSRGSDVPPAPAAGGDSLPLPFKSHRPYKAKQQSHKDSAISLGADDGIWTHTSLDTGTWNQRVCRSATSAYSVENWKWKVESYLEDFIILTKIFSISTQSFNIEAVSASDR